MLYRSKKSTPGKVFALLIVLGILVGVGFFYYDNRSAQQNAPAATLAAQVAAPLTTISPAAPLQTTTPIANVVAPSPSSTIFIPSLAIYSPVITSIIRNGTWDVDNLGTNVGYLQGTAWLGQQGNIVLSGHVEMSDGRQGIFSSLRDIALGDEIVLSEGDAQFRYAVREMRSVQPDDLSVVQPTTTEVLTLITCTSYNFLRNTYDERFVVIAERIS